MNAVNFITRQHLWTMLRQKETLMWTFLMPLVFFYFIGTVTGGSAITGQSTKSDSLSLVGAEDGGFLVDQLRERLEAQNYVVTLRTLDDPELAQASRRLVLPAPAAGFVTLTDSVLDGNVAELAFERDGEGASASFDQVRIGRAVYGLLADMVVAGEDGEIIAESLAAVAAETRPLTLKVEHAGHRNHIPNGFEQTIPGTTVMFTMMILLTGGAILLVIERQQGLFRRLASTPITRAQLVGGKWLGMCALACIQVGFAMLAGVLFFDMDWGPNVGMVVLVMFVWAAFNSSLAMFLAGFARSEAQMSAIGVMGTMALAALGGCWWPIEVTPSWMQSLAICLPTGWAMDAMHHLVSFGDGPASVLPHLAMLSASALILGLLAVKKFRYQ
ncbi:MAG: ABC-2 type transport system permease protein [Planctomycetota bacterium]|jgi:ABC-2 type transport system permease protein